MSDVPSLFRMILHVSDTDRAAGFYARLLGAAGRRSRRWQRPAAAGS